MEDDEMLVAAREYIAALRAEVSDLSAENERLRAALVKLAKSYRADASRLFHSDLQRIEIIDAALARQTEGEG